MITGQVNGSLASRFMTPNSKLERYLEAYNLSAPALNPSPQPSLPEDKWSLKKKKKKQFTWPPSSGFANLPNKSFSLSPLFLKYSGPFPSGKHMNLDSVLGTVRTFQERILPRVGG